MTDVRGIEIVDDQTVGEGGFLQIRRLRLKNRRADGTLSATYLVDYVMRPKGFDAVVVALFQRDPGGGAQVLLRDGLRPPVKIAREREPVPIPETRDHYFFREVVAGILEDSDRGEDGIKRRAAIEVEEEAGYRVRAEDVVLLGAGTFPSPGAFPERYWLSAVEIADPSAQRPPPGDGSPMEEGARTQWMALDDAIAACVAGEIEDCKTELALRRLRDWLQSSSRA